ncbi:hypothetical protein [Sphingobacterium siyangense]|uniref:hypothetical protein n=1 Tax=Sphingobacterium siyangense TaxID=459529 RepID=UPI002FDAADF9
MSCVLFKLSFTFLLIGAVSLLNISCNSKDTDLNSTLKLSGDNRKELETVLAYYKNKGDMDKLRAANFLIGNMKDKFSLTNRSNQPFNQILNLIDSIWDHGNSGVIDNTKYLQRKWDSLSNIYGPPVINEKDKDYDYSTIKAKYLIEHIDHSFSVWKSKDWAKGVNFEDFCEYILPYRIGTEEIEPWSLRLYNEWLPYLKKKELDSTLKISKYINDYNSYKMKHMKMLWSYPYDFTTTEFERIRVGNCKMSVHYTTQVLRSLGIPTAVDFTPRWAGSNNGHEWNVIFLENGKAHPFDAIHRGLNIDFSWRKIAKVYRKTFAKQILSINTEYLSEIPKDLVENYAKDVTSEYVKTSDIDLPIDNIEGHHYAIISSYHGFEWIPQDWGDIKKGKAHFRNIGVGNLYSIFIYHNNKYTRKTQPFFIDTLGKIEFFKPDFKNKQEMRLERKFPLTPFMKNIMSFIIGNKIQGGNTRDFKDSITFFTIADTPMNIKTVEIHDHKKYRYVRMWIPRGGRGDMAELEFYGLSPNKKDTIKLSGEIIGDPKIDIRGKRYYTYPFDENLLTYYLRPRGGDPWVGLDFGKAQRIVKVRYCPRSDTNFIEVGDEYELFLWDLDDWKSLGRRQADSQYVVFNNMPKNGLYILVNLNKGVENKIFSYNGGHQIWR